MLKRWGFQRRWGGANQQAVAKAWDDWGRELAKKVRERMEKERMEDVSDLDDNGYPSENVLEKIRQWPYEDPGGCLDYVQSLWHWEEMASNPIEGRYRFATGGWSGNEDLIAAIMQNTMVHTMCWQFSSRGGLHLYELPSLPMDMPRAYFEPHELNRELKKLERYSLGAWPPKKDINGAFVKLEDAKKTLGLSDDPAPEQFIAELPEAVHWLLANAPEEAMDSEGVVVRYSISSRRFESSDDNGIWWAEDVNGIALPLCINGHTKDVK